MLINLEKIIKPMKNYTPLVFAGLLFLIVIVLPNSGQGEIVKLSWWDQSVFLKALQEVLAGKPSWSVDNGLVGSGYITLGVLVTKLFSIDPKRSLVLLNRFSFISTTLMFYWISLFLNYRALNQINIIEKSAKTNHKITASLVAFIYSLTLIFSSNFVSFSDIPWSHFPASLMAMSCLLLIFYIEESYRHKKNRKLLFELSGFGFLLGLLVQIRTFEGIALALGIATWLSLLGLIYPLATIKRLKNSNGFKLIKLMIVVSLSYSISFFTSMIVTNQKNINLLYQGLTKIEYDPILKEMYTTYPDIFPLKFIQLFIDPNFFSYNQNYEIESLVFGFDFDSFQMPFLLQVPFLLYAMPAVIIILIISTYRRNLKVILKDSSFVIPIITGLVLTVAYLGSPLFGSPHLKYGVVRNMMLVMWCLALVAGPWHFYPYVLPCRRRLLLKRLVGLCSIPILVSVVYGQIIVQFTGFWEFEKMHIEKIELDKTCRELTCSLNVISYNDQGQIIKIPNQRYIVAGICPSSQKRMATTVNPDQSFTLLPCSERYQVDIYPINMGFAGTSEVPVSWQFTPPNSGQ